MKEIWKLIKFKGKKYPRYKVSNLGNIKKDDKKIKLLILNDKYYTIYLTDKGVYTPAMVHVLVWEAFKGKAPKLFKIQHKDKNGFNTRLDNLKLTNKRIISQKDNGLPIGVSFRKDSKRYVVSFGLNCKRISLGTYLCPKVASGAYQTAYKLSIKKDNPDKYEIKAAVNEYRAKKGLKKLTNNKDKVYEDIKPKHIVYKY